MPYSHRMALVGLGRSFCKTSATWVTVYDSVGATGSLSLCESHSLADLRNCSAAARPDRYLSCLT